MAVDLSIVIVSWNVRDLLRQCLRSVLGHADVSASPGPVALGDHKAEVFVVDNASHDGSAEMVRNEFPMVTLLAEQRNLGFTAGNNVALRRCTGRYYLLLNPDTVVGDDAITAMVDYMDAHGDVGVVGPRLLYGDGRPQPSRRRFPRLRHALFESTLLEQWLPDNRWARHYRMADQPDDIVQDVDWVTGACMMVRAAAVEQVGLLDEGFFMYSEELDWCRRIADAGWRVVYLPEPTVVHFEGRSSGQVSAKRNIYFESSKVRYFCRHEGRARAEILRIFLLVGYVFRMAEEGTKYVLGHRRALRRDRLQAYWRVLRSGLKMPRQTSGNHV